MVGVERGVGVLGLGVAKQVGALEASKHEGY